MILSDCQAALMVFIREQRRFLSKKLDRRISLNDAERMTIQALEDAKTTRMEREKARRLRDPKTQGELCFEDEMRRK